MLDGFVNILQYFRERSKCDSGALKSPYGIAVLNIFSHYKISTPETNVVVFLIAFKVNLLWVCNLLNQNKLQTVAALKR